MAPYPFVAWILMGETLVGMKIVDLIPNNAEP